MMAHPPSSRANIRVPFWVLNIDFPSIVLSGIVAITLPFVAEMILTPLP